MLEENNINISDEQLDTENNTQVEKEPLPVYYELQP